MTTEYAAELELTLDKAAIDHMQQLVPKIPVGEHVYAFAVRLARMSRPGQGQQPEFIDSDVNWGAGPRASIYLLMAAKARAILHGRHHATTDDVLAMSLPVLRHRVLPSFNAEADGRTAEDIIRRLIKAVPGQRREVGRASSA